MILVAWPTSDVLVILDTINQKIQFPAPTINTSINRIKPSLANLLVDNWIINQNCHPLTV